MGVLRFRLRDATASAHRRVEAAMDLNNRCRRAGAYRELLARLWGLYQPLEAKLGRIDWGQADVRFGDRVKAPWIEADLITLGMSRPDIGKLPRMAVLPPLADGLDGLGALYVLEGASLGGQIISRRLAADLDMTAELGGRFFFSYGRRVGERWRDFVSVLERYADDDASAARIEASALATFDSFLAWFEDGKTALSGLHEARL
jgi:heme oxygenase